MFFIQDEIPDLIKNNNLKIDHTINGVNIINNFYKYNNYIILEIINKSRKHLSTYFIFDYEYYEFVLKQPVCWTVTYKNKPYLVLRHYDKTTNKTKTEFFSKLLGKFYYSYENNYQYIIEFSTNNYFDYRKFNIKLIPQLKTDFNKDINYNEYILDFKKRYPTALKLYDKHFITNGIFKSNLYFRLDNNTTVLIIIVYNSDKNTESFKESIELLIDTSMAFTLRKKKWVIIHQRLHNSVFTNVISTNFKDNKTEKITLGRYILRYNKMIFRDDIISLHFKNNNRLDYRLNNLFYKRTFKNSNEELNPEIINQNKNQFQYRFIFNELTDIPSYWRKIHENYFNRFYLIADDIVAAVTKIKYYHVGNKHVSTIIDLDTFKKIKKLNAGCVPFRDTRRPEYMIYINLYFDKMHKTRLHRFVVGEEDSEIFIDHINRDTLDNRRVNLRRSTVRFNNRNISVRQNTPHGVIGIKFRKDLNRWKSKRTMKNYLNNNEIKHRSVLSNDFETAVIYRKQLELISDEDFLSDKTTWVLLNEYKEAGKFDQLYF